MVYFRLILILVHQKLISLDREIKYCHCPLVGFPGHPVNHTQTTGCVNERGIVPRINFRMFTRRKTGCQAKKKKIFFTNINMHFKGESMVIAP